MEFLTILKLSKMNVCCFYFSDQFSQGKINTAAGEHLMWQYCLKESYVDQIFDSPSTNANSEFRNQLFRNT